MLQGRELSQQLCDDAVAPLECDVPHEMSLDEWSESRRVNRVRRIRRWWPAALRSRRAAEDHTSAGTGSSSAAPRSRSAK